MVAKYIPNRGDIVWVNFNPTRGREQTGKRPALVLSPKSYNVKSSLVIACPITSKVKGYPFEVQIITNEIEGVVLVDQIKSLDWRERKVVFVQKAPKAALKKTQRLLLLLVKE